MPLERVVHIVDDSSAVLRALERLLNTANYAVHCYERPRDFLEAAKHSIDGCVILDLRMPDLDGLQVQARLREMGNRLPVIFLTAYGNVKAAVQAMKAGAVDFVEKPVADKALFAAIDKALEWSRAQSEPRESRDAARRIAALTPRERLVLERDARGPARQCCCVRPGRQRPGRRSSAQDAPSASWGRGAVAGHSLGCDRAIAAPALDASVEELSRASSADAPGSTQATLR